MFDDVFVWFKRDLPCSDHPALALAPASAVLPLYIAEPHYRRLADISARQWAFAAESLVGLREELGALGAPLVVRTGEAVAVLDALCRKHRIGRIVSHEETGNLWTYARDRRVAAWARAAGIEWIELPQSGVVRRLKGRDGWAARRNGFMAEPLAAIPALSLRAGGGAGPIPSARGCG